MFIGEYDGFDENEFTSASGGKGKVIEFLKNKHNYENIVMIGDGATDLETCPPAVISNFMNVFYFL
jgi:phosphoserine phosphatase